MNIVPCKSKTCFLVTRDLVSRSEGIVVIPGPDRSSIIDRFANTAQVIPRVKEIVRSLLLALREETFCGRATHGIAFFAEFLATPKKTGVGGDDRILFLDNADAAAQPVVAELAAVGAVVDGDEAVLGIPLERAGAVASRVPVGVVGEAIRVAGNRDL